MSAPIEKWKRMRLAQALTQGAGVSETQREMYSASGKAWSARAGDTRGENDIPAILFSRIQRKGKDTTFQWFVEEVIPFGDYARKPEWGEKSIQISTFPKKESRGSSGGGGGGKKASSTQLDPETPGAKFEMELRTFQTVKCLSMDSRDTSQCALSMVWLSGVKYAREHFVAEDKAPATAGAASRRTAAPSGGEGGEADENAGAAAATAAAGAAQRGPACNYSFVLYVNRMRSMTQEESEAAWTAFNKNNRVILEPGTLQRASLAKIMGEDWLAHPRASIPKMDRALIVRVDNTVDVSALKAPYCVAAFEKIEDKHYDKSFTRMMGPDPNSLVERHVVQTMRLGYTKPGDIMLSVLQNSESDPETLDCVVNMHLTVFQEDIIPFDLDLEEWKQYGPVLFQHARGWYGGRRSGDELAQDQNGTLPDSDVDQVHLRVRGHMGFDLAETVTAAGFVLSPEQFEENFPENVVDGDDPYQPPPAPDPFQGYTHIIKTRSLATRVANLLRVSGDITKLKEAVRAGDAYVVMVTASHRIPPAKRAEIQANPDRKQALEEFMQSKWYITQLDENSNPLPPDTIFYAVSKTGPIAALIKKDEPPPTQSAAASKRARMQAAFA